MSQVNPPHDPVQPGQATPPTQPVPQGYPAPQGGYPQGPPQGGPGQGGYPQGPPQGGPGQAGYPQGPPQGGQGGVPMPPHGPQGYAGPQGGGGFTGPPKSGNSKILYMVIGGVVIFAIIGALMMFVFGKKDEEPQPPEVPTVSGPEVPGGEPTDTPSDTPSTSGAPTTTSGGGGGTTPAGGTSLDIAAGVKATVPAGWKVDEKVSGGVILFNETASTYIQIQAFANQKQDESELCTLLQDAATKGLASVKKSACKAGPASGRIKTATGSVTGTYSTSQGSLSLGTLVLAGVRDDGLVTGTQVTFPTKKPPTEAQLKEAVAIWASVIVSQNSAA